MIDSCLDALEELFSGTSRVNWSCLFERQIDDIAFRIFEHNILEQKVAIIEYAEPFEDEHGNMDTLLFILNPEAIENAKNKLGFH